jgi:hypothetical protein
MIAGLLPISSQGMGTTCCVPTAVGPLCRWPIWRSALTYSPGPAGDLGDRCTLWPATISKARYASPELEYAGLAVGAASRIG